MSEPAQSCTGPTRHRKSRLASLDARLATLRIGNGYVGGVPPLVTAQLLALQADIRGSLAAETVPGRQ
mgnify:CR=1 FL=1